MALDEGFNHVLSLGIQMFGVHVAKFATHSLKAGYVHYSKDPYKMK